MDHYCLLDDLSYVIYILSYAGVNARTLVALSLHIQVIAYTRNDKNYEIRGTHLKAYVN